MAAESGFTRDEARRPSRCCAASSTPSALADDRAFQRRYTVPVSRSRGRRGAVDLDADEGVRQVDAEIAGKLAPATPDGIHTFASQTHPADGCRRRRRHHASTGPARCRRRRRPPPGLGVRARRRRAMPRGARPAARAALAAAGLDFADLHGRHHAQPVRGQRPLLRPRDRDRARGHERPRLQPRLRPPAGPDGVALDRRAGRDPPGPRRGIAACSPGARPATPAPPSSWRSTHDQHLDPPHVRPTTDPPRGRHGRAGPAAIVRAAGRARRVSIVHEFRAHAEAHPDRLLVAEPSVKGGWASTTWGEMRVAVDRAGPGPARPGSRRPPGHDPVRQQPAAPHRHARGDDPRRPGRAVERRLRAAEQPITPSCGRWPSWSGRAGRRRGRRRSRAAVGGRGGRVRRSLGDVPGGLTVDDLWRRAGRPRSTTRCARPGAADTVAKILFTSGLHRHAEGRDQHARDARRPTSSRCARPGRSWPTSRPVLLDWLPWSHTFGGNHDLNMVLDQRRHALDRRRATRARR